jgi:hypothetical protein
MANRRETSKCQRKREDAGVHFKAPHYALTIITERAYPSLVTHGWIGDIDTGEYVIVARPDIAFGWPERQPNQRYMLQTVSGEALPTLK